MTEGSSGNSPVRVVWSNANVNENFPAPVSPLLYSVAATGYSHYFRNLALAFGVSAKRISRLEPAFRQIVGVHGGRIYYHLSHIPQILRGVPGGEFLARSFDDFVGAEGSAAGHSSAQDPGLGMAADGRLRLRPIPQPPPPGDGSRTAHRRLLPDLSDRRARPQVRSRAG